MNPIEALRAKLAQVAGDMAALIAAVQAESRAMTADEDAKFKALDREYKDIEASIQNMERVEELRASMAVPQPRVIDTPAAATAAPQPRPEITGGTPAAHNYANHGFAKGPGEYLMAVHRAGSEGFRDPRLKVNAVTTFGGESVGADGAFALPPQFMPGITNAIMPEDSLIAALNPVQTNSTTLVVPKNENAPWSTSGVTSAKTAEGAQITASKPAISEARVTLYKAASLVHVSEESLADIPFLSTWVMDQMGQHLRYQLENWIINGTGEGEPLGILNAACTVALTDADSTASAIGAVDILQMEATLLPGSGAFWVGNPTIFPAIASMKTGSAGYPLFQPDMSVASKRALLGRPFYTSEACPILNTTGDIILIQPTGYILALKAGGPQTATTVGFAFDQDLQSFRATLRMGGAPLLSAKVARAKSAGSTYASHFVVITGSRS